MTFRNSEFAELPGDMDPECVALCNSINRLVGLCTTVSCCGHGSDPFRIWFDVEERDDLLPLLYWLDACHSGVPGWSVRVRTDCLMDGVSFFLEGPVADYRGATTIARCIEAFVETLEETDSVESAVEAGVTTIRDGKK